MASTVDIKAFIDERPITAFQCFLVAMCFVVVAAEGMDVAIMGFVIAIVLAQRGSVYEGTKAYAVH